MAGWRVGGSRVRSGSDVRVRKRVEAGGRNIKGREKEKKGVRRREGVKNGRAWFYPAEATLTGGRKSAPKSARKLTEGRKRK